MLATPCRVHATQPLGLLDVAVLLFRVPSPFLRLLSALLSDSLLSKSASLMDLPITAENLLLREE